MRHENIEYMMRKEAQLIETMLGGAAIGEVTYDSLSGIAPYLVLVPLMAGGLGGYIASKMTSPTDTSLRTMQKNIVLEKLQTARAMRERAAEYRERLEKINRLVDQRRQKRDPFL